MPDTGTGCDDNEMSDAEVFDAALKLGAAAKAGDVDTMAEVADDLKKKGLHT